MARRKPRTQPKIDLQELLHGDRPEWADVVEFWRLGEFDDEKYLVMAIKKHLRTPEQKGKLDAADVSLVELLNGRTTAKHENLMHEIQTAWNLKLGFKAFLHGDDPEKTSVAKPREPSQQELETLWKTVQAWVTKVQPSCSESCYQMDSVNEECPELAIQVCDIVGYFKDED